METIEALRLAWTGEPVTYTGRFVQLAEAICTPAPPEPPGVVEGIGGSRGTLARLLPLADELNLYADEDLVVEARAAVGSAGLATTLSVFLSWEWDKWPDDPEAELDAWAARGIDRAAAGLVQPAPRTFVQAVAADMRDVRPRR